VKFKLPLHEGVLLQRYKRFFADVELNGEKLTIHVPNTGSLKGVIEKGFRHKCWFSLHGDESKKLKGTLEAVQAANGTWVGVNTSNPNKIVEEAVASAIGGKSGLAHWRGYGFYKPEHKLSKETRLDGVLCKQESDLANDSSIKHFIEIKNTTLMQERDGKKLAMFPDAVTERGQKHIVELMQLMEQGHSAELIFTVQRDDVTAFAVAEEIDPEYARLLKLAKKKGLIVSPVLVGINQTDVYLTDRVLEALI
jgi:sugar fermentation stimulation protein A